MKTNEAGSDLVTEEEGLYFRWDAPFRWKRPL